MRRIFKQSCFSIRPHRICVTSHLIILIGVISIVSCHNDTLDELQNEIENSTTVSKKIDHTFHISSSIFENHLKNVDFTIIPGYNEDEYLDNWIPPRELLRDFPTYISGYDSKNQPIWIMEYGKYKYSKYVRGGTKKRELFEKYFRYLSVSCLKSHALKSTKEQRVNHHVLILDLEGLKLSDLLNREVLHFQLKVISNYRHFYEKYVSKIIIINVNTVSEVLLTMARPFIIRVLDRLEVYGTNKAVWAPELVARFSKDQIPEWYGGNKGFRPLYVIG